MATSKDYYLYILDLLREVEGISSKKMMGEYILYKNNVIFGGIYDNRFLVKKSPSLEEYEFKEVIPYPNAKAMLLVDLEDPSCVKDIVNTLYKELSK